MPGFEKKPAKKRVMCAGKTFAPYGMKLGGGEPEVCKAYEPTKSGDLPGKVDLRTHMSPVEDQSQSNSCCANAVAGAFEYINMRHCKENGDTPADISRLFIYYVGRKRDQKMWGEKGAVEDGGMTISGAITAMQTHGACMEKDWPFTLEHVNKKPTDECFADASKYKVLEASKVPVDLDSMRRCLAEGHPIVFGLKLTQRFFNPRQGHCGTPDPSDPKAAEHGLHAMLLVGYNDRQSVFIVRNSWGTSWGDEGYGYVPYDYAASRDFNIGDMYAIKGLTEVDFTPDDDDGVDPELPNGDEGDDEPVENFDIEDDIPPGDELDVDLDFDMLDSVKRTFFANGEQKVNRSTLHMVGILTSRIDPNFVSWLSQKMREGGEDAEYSYDDYMALVKEFNDL